ncbi:DMT family transporter [Gemmobacter serpentinus]|uniref:DMT family transporter n=1 Tax=Gemmobacter serpentinus TaxID=2652247 RepID=UPI001CF6E15F|nr:DMT family transporter [Gemmobacter serpentinus]
MSSANMPIAAPDRPMAAAGLVLIYAMVIGFTDNYVQVIAAEAGLWQFHATRGAFAWAILLALAVPLGLKLRPRNMKAVVARSMIHAGAMLIYFGALAFLPVALVAAGLFTAPIFVLLISRLAYGHHIGPVRIVAVAVGFAGVLLVLGPEARGEASLAALLPVLAGALYALGNIATREWCGGETAETLLGGFFAALGVAGCLGMIVLGIWPLNPAPGAEGFVARGAVWPSNTFLFWTSIQAAGSLLGVGMMIKAYQLADASRVSVIEYLILPAAALWGWLLWGQTLGMTAILGMGLIVAAGMMIALRRPQV